jgi:carbon-monoxide dehydrogenase medium subunit
MWHLYHTPTSVDETLELLAQHRGKARIIAGGTDLLIELERKARSASVLVDVTRIPGLNQIRLENGWIHLGPTVTHNHAVASPLLRERAFPLAAACWQVGSPQIRNRGTIAGNLVTASPANDTIPPMVALGARVTLASRRGQRTLPLADFHTGVRRTVMADDEMLVDVAFPALAANQRGTFLKLGLRRAQAISVVNVAVLVELDDSQRPGSAIRRASIALGSVAPTIVRAQEAEEFLVGRQLDEPIIQQASQLAVRAARPIDDIRGTADYRRQMVQVLTARALRQLRDGTERADIPASPVLLGHPPTMGEGLPDFRSLGDFGSLPIQMGEGLPTEPPVTGESRLVVNGRPVTVHGAAGKRLLDILRDDLGLTGTKEGCAEGECGACTVLLDGMAVMSCLVPAPAAYGRQVVTVEGLARDRELHPLQRAFIETGAVQCGYCTPGFLMSAICVGAPGTTRFWQRSRRRRKGLPAEER